MKITKTEAKRRIEMVSEIGGILPQFEAFYIHSIMYNTSRALDAFARYDEGLRNNASSIEIVSFAHEALGHAAALSRFFWPVRADRIHQIRAKRLRESFRVEDTSPLKNRDIRNALEHFDERVDHYLLNHDSGQFFPTALVDSHEIADDPTARIFKLVDPEEQVFVILNEKFEFGLIQEEIDRLASLAVEFDKNGARLPYCENI